jgi:hypothetical protein
MIRLMFSPSILSKHPKHTLIIVQNKKNERNKNMKDILLRKWSIVPFIKGEDEPFHLFMILLLMSPYIILCIFSWPLVNLYNLSEL